MTKIKNGKLRYNVSKSSNSFKRVHSVGDGNCFYRSLSRYLYNIQDQHKEIRESIVNYMEQHQSSFTCFIDGNFLKHVNEQKKTDGDISSWATEAELYAASAKFGINIKVTRQFNESPQWNNYTYIITTKRNSESFIPYRHSMYLLLQNEHLIYYLVIKRLEL